MLAEFDYAKGELAGVRDKLRELGAHRRRSKNQDAEIAFLKARMLDLFRSIYVDSETTLEHVATATKEAPIAELLEFVDRALAVSPPLRRSLSSDEETRTAQVLIDAALWRSKFVWICAVGFVASAAVALGLLGFSITDLSKQGELVRKTLVDAKAESERTISNAKTEAQQNIRILNDGIREIEGKRVEVDTKRKEIVAQIEALQNPDHTVNKTVARFNSELSRLADLEREWARQREKLAAELTRHEGFLTGKEDQVNRKVAEFERLVGEHTRAIDATVERARGAETMLTRLVDTAQANSDKIAGLVGRADADANVLRAAREQAAEAVTAIRENGEKAGAARRDAEEARDRVRGAEDQLNRDIADRIGKLDRLIIEAEGSKKRIDVLVGEAAEARTEFGKLIDAQRKAVNDATTAATKAVGDAREKFVGDVTESARQATGVLTFAQSTAGRSVQLIQEAEKDTVARSSAIRTTGISVDKLQTEITSKLEQLKTDEERLKGERDRSKIDLDRVREIIKTVEDKHANIQEKLHVLLDARPSIDGASIWKLITGSYVLLGSIGAVSIWLLILTVVTLWRRAASS